MYDYNKCRFKTLSKQGVQGEQVTQGTQSGEDKVERNQEEEDKEGKRYIGMLHGYQGGRRRTSCWSDNCAGLVRY